jgi:pimeloyl-ACP methyl ester carboxylesterase
MGNDRRRVRQRQGDMNVKKRRRGPCDRAGFVWTFPALLGLFACSSAHESAVGPDSSTAPLKFGACSSDLVGSSASRACASVKAPLRWDEPHGQSIELSVVRYASASPHHGQLWLLDGGPGGTGATFMNDTVRPLYQSLGLDVYVPQHRGTGHSTPLSCERPDDIRACGEEVSSTWGAGLQGFHSVEAGRDVGFLIGRTRAGGEPVFVLGLSYGSYWAQRYLQSFPQQASGVILEGVLPLGEALWEGDPLADAAGRSLFQACRDDSDCRAAFGTKDPEDVAHALLALADDPARRCLGEDGADRITSESVLSLLIVGELGQAVPGLLRRLDRCSAQDQSELLAFGALLAQASNTAPDPSVVNPVLGMHVMRSDIMAQVSSFPVDELIARREPLVFWSGAAFTEQFAAIAEGWPVTYPPAPSEVNAPITPVLLMNGGLDIQTPSPWARELAPELGGTLVEFPFVGHGVDIGLASPFTANDASCSLGILRAFIADPGAPIDADCAESAYVPDVAGRSAASQNLAAALYGTDTPLLGAPDDAPSARRVGSSARAQEIDTLAQTVRDALGRAARQLRAGSLPRLE